MIYHKFRWHASTVHMIEADLEVETVRPVLATERFPFKMNYPVPIAIDQGAIGTVGGGFNMQIGHKTGVSDQPLHALAVDSEVWTTGIGAGGYGLCIGSDKAYVHQNKIEVRLWTRGNRSYPISHINRGHDGDIVAFTPRGGSNEYPKQNRDNGRDTAKQFVALGLATPFVDDGDDSDITGYQVTVMKISQGYAIPVWPKTAVIESVGALDLELGEVVMWVQKLGGIGVRDIVSGTPQIIRDGVNICPLLNLDPEAPKGPDNWFVRKNPRMALGVDVTGTKVYMVTVEGRIDSSVGLRLKELATMMVDHGVHDAVNMDGGGSAFMWTRKGGLVAPGCYNYSKTLDGLRPDHYATAVFPR